MAGQRYNDSLSKLLSDLNRLLRLPQITALICDRTQYFKNSGITNAFIISMITSSVNTASTLPGLYAIDKWGRRPLLFWGGEFSHQHIKKCADVLTAIGMTVSQLLVAVLGTTTTGQDADGNVFSKNLGAQKASIAFVCIYIFFFAATWVRSFTNIRIADLIYPSFSISHDSSPPIQLTPPRVPSHGLSLARFSHSRPEQRACQ